MNMIKKQSLLGRLKRVVNKVRFLLSSAVLSRTWQIASAIRRASTLPRQHRHLSFNDRQPSGLIQICNSDDDQGVTISSSPEDNRLIRTISYPSDDDDINKRAEDFINNFRRQLQMERQISLQLRYCRTNSFQLSPWNSWDLCIFIWFSFWFFLGKDLMNLFSSNWGWRDDCLICLFFILACLWIYHIQIFVKYVSRSILFSSKNDRRFFFSFLFVCSLFFLIVIRSFNAKVILGIQIMHVSTRVITLLSFSVAS